MRASPLLIPVLVAALLVAALGGCEVIETADREIAEREAAVVGAAAGFAREAAPHVSVVDRPLLGTEATAFTGGTPLPTRLELNPGGFRYSGSDDVPLALALASIRTAAGVPVVLEDDVSQGAGEAIGDLPYWSGPLSAFLDVLATEYDVAWSYERRAIRVRPYLTRTYVLPTPIAKPLFESRSAAAGSGDATGTQEIAASFADADPWRDVDTLLRASLPADARYVSSVSSGEVTVTARPSDLARLEILIDGLYDRHGSQVLLRVSWMVVDLTASDDYQLDLQAVFRDAASGLRVATNSPVSNLAEVAGAGGLAIVNAPDSSDLASFDASRLLYTALSRSGRLLDHRTFAQAVQNNTPFSFNDRELRDYLKNVTRQIGTDGSGDTFATDTETLSLGSSLQVLPRVLSGNRVSLLLALSQAALVELRTISLGDSGSFIQLARQSRREIPAEEVILQNGQSLVLAGFEGDTVSREELGTGSAGFFGLGGAQGAEIKRTRLILVVTATIRKPPPRRQPPAVVLTRKAVP